MPNDDAATTATADPAANTAAAAASASANDADVNNSSARTGDDGVAPNIDRTASDSAYALDGVGVGDDGATRPTGGSTDEGRAEEDGNVVGSSAAAAAPATTAAGDGVAAEDDGDDAGGKPGDDGASASKNKEWTLEEVVTPKKESTQQQTMTMAAGTLESSGSNADMEMKMKAADSRGGKNGAGDANGGSVAKGVARTDTDTQRKGGAGASSAVADVEMADSAVRKSDRARVPTSRLIESAMMEGGDERPNAVPTTPEELYDQIKKSRDKLFFIAYSHSQDPLIVDDTPSKRKGKKKEKEKEAEYNWYLVRVDLSTCRQLEDTENCQSTGRYYVEFYTKASYDRGVLLAGNPLENGVPASKMRPKPDSDSRYWLEWHEYYFDKSGDMVVGKAKEFLPNSRKAINRRLMDLSQRKQRTMGGGGSPTSSLGEDGGSGSEGEDRLMSEYHPDFDKYTTWADVMDLMDPRTRLMGPFDFDDVKPPPLTEDHVKMFNEEIRGLLAENHADLHVKDRVHCGRWEELAEAIAGSGRDIEPPVIAVERRRKKRPSSSGGGKRAREEQSKERSLAAEQQVEKRPRETKSKKEPVCWVCGEGAMEKKVLHHFSATTSKPAFYVHTSCSKNNSDVALVSREKLNEDILCMVESAFDDTRHSSWAHGKAYYVLREFKDALSETFGSWMGVTEARAPPSSSKGESKTSTTIAVKSPEPLEGLPESAFAEGEVESCPVAFAYYSEDPSGISEENAKIATLEHGAEQRRRKRGSSADAGGGGHNKQRSGAGGGSTKSSPRKNGHPTLGEKDALVAPEPAPGLPDGWEMRKVPRGGKPASRTTKMDQFFYSPKLHFRFRGRPEALRFVEAMNGSGGDEKLAMETF